jgi:putative transcriptional regulator
METFKSIKASINKKLSSSHGVNTTSIAKLGKGKNITIEVLLRICMALKSDISDMLRDDFTEE